MVNYSSLLFVALLCFVTVSGASSPSTPDIRTANEKRWNELLEFSTYVFEGLLDTSGSSNVFVNSWREMVEKYIEFLDNTKKEIQHAVTEGVEMEKKIKNISHILKSSTNLLTNELKSEVVAIEKNVTNELTKLKGMNSAKDIDNMEKELKDNFKDIQAKIIVLSNSGLHMTKEAETSLTMPVDPLIDLKTKTLDFVKAAVPAAFAAKQNEDKLYNKIQTTYNSLSKIRDGLVRVEQIHYDLLQLNKKNSETDATFLTFISLAQFFFTVMFGMFFYSF